MLAIATVRDEEDVIRPTVELLLEQGCRVVVADNLSSDDTRQELSGLPVILMRDDDPGYYQSRKMTALAELHAEPGEWVIPFDADERWHHLDRLTDDWDVAEARPHVHIGDRTIGPEPLPKVAFRWQPGCVIDMGNHGVQGAGPRVLRGALEVCHFQYRSLQQVRRKVRNGVEAYNHTSLPQSFGSHWRHLASLSDAGLSDWWECYRTQETQPCPV